MIEKGFSSLPSSSSVVMPNIEEKMSGEEKNISQPSPRDEIGAMIDNDHDVRLLQYSTPSKPLAKRAKI